MIAKVLKNRTLQPLRHFPKVTNKGHLLPLKMIYLSCGALFSLACSDTHQHQTDRDLTIDESIPRDSSSVLVSQSLNASFDPQSAERLSGPFAEELYAHRGELAESLCRDAMPLVEGVQIVDKSYTLDLITDNCEEGWDRAIARRGDIPFKVMVPARSAIRVKALSRGPELELNYVPHSDPSLRLALIEDDPRYCTLRYAPGSEQRLGEPLLPCEASTKGDSELTWYNNSDQDADMLLLALDITSSCAYLEADCVESSPPLYLEMSFFTPELGDRCDQDAPLINLIQDDTSGEEGFISDLSPQNFEGFSNRYPARLWERRLTPIGELDDDQLSCLHGVGRDRVYRIEVPPQQTIYSIQGPFDIFFAEDQAACDRACTTSVSRHYSNLSEEPKEIFMIVGERDGLSLSSDFNLQVKSVTTSVGSLCSAPLSLDEGELYGDLIELQSPNTDYPTTDSYQIGYLNASEQELGDRSESQVSLNAERCALIDDRENSINGPERVYQLDVPPLSLATIELEVQDMSNEGELSWGPDFKLSLNVAEEEGAICEQGLSCVAHADASSDLLRAQIFNPSEEQFKSHLLVVESAIASQLLNMYSFEDRPFVSYYINYQLSDVPADDRFSTAETELRYQRLEYETLTAQTLDGFRADYPRGEGCQSYPPSGADRVYKLVIPSNRHATVTVTPANRSTSDLDLVLNVFDEDRARHEGVDRVCMSTGADKFGVGGEETIGVTNELNEPRTLFLVVGSYGVFTTGQRFSLSAKHCAIIPDNQGGYNECQ